VIEIVSIVVEAAEGGPFARAVGESIFTEGDTLEAVKANVRDAVECHFEEGHIPRIISLHFVRDEILTISNAGHPGIEHDSESAPA